MTNKQRVFAAFDGKPVDRVPVGFWFHFLEDRQMDGALEDPALFQRNLDGHRHYIQSVHPDFVKVMSDGFFHYPAGAGAAYQTPEDLDQITALPQDHPWIAKQVELAAAVTALQADTAYFYNFFSPIANLHWLVGDGLWTLLEQDGGAVSSALDRISQGLGTLAEQLIRKAGVDGIYLSVRNPNPALITDDVYRKLVAPSETRLLEQAGSIAPNHILHICGYTGNRNNLELYRDYPVKAFNWAVHVEKVGLAQGKKLFGGKAVIGGYDNTTGSLIHKGSKEDIQAAARSILREAGDVGVLLGADCTVPSDIQVEHLEWVRQAAQSR